MKFHEATNLKNPDHMKPGDIFDAKKSDGYRLLGTGEFQNVRSGQVVTLRSYHFNLEGQIIKAKPEHVNIRDLTFNTLDKISHHIEDQKVTFHMCNLQRFIVAGEQNTHLLYDELVEAVQEIYNETTELENCFYGPLKGILDKIKKHREDNSSRKNETSAPE